MSDAVSAMEKAEQGKGKEPQEDQWTRFESKSDGKEARSQVRTWRRAFQAVGHT